MTPLKKAGLAIAGVILLLILGTYWLRPRSTPLPPKAQVQVDRDQIARAVDTAEVNRLAGEQALAKTRELAAGRARKTLEDSAAHEHHRADSLAAIAAQVQTSADSSAQAWRHAYESRTREADELRRSLDSAKAETQHADVQVAKADTTAAVDLRHAVRADSLTHTLIDVASQGDRCKVLWVINCPSRTESAVAGAVVGAATAALGYELVTGKIKVRIPFP